MGCTICYSENYDPEAVLEDGSCVFTHADILGKYRVQDSVVGPFQDVYYSEPYEIEIQMESCTDDELEIYNYAQLKYAVSEEPILVQFQREQDSIVIINQSLLQNNDGLWTEYGIGRSIGYFKGDSIFFPISYNTPFDPYYGSCWGKKID